MARLSEIKSKFIIIEKKIDNVETTLTKKNRSQGLKHST